MNGPIMEDQCTYEYCVGNHLKCCFYRCGFVKINESTSNPKLQRFESYLDPGPYVLV